MPSRRGYVADWVGAGYYSSRPDALTRAGGLRRQGRTVKVIKTYGAWQVKVRAATPGEKRWRHKL